MAQTRAMTEDERAWLSDWLAYARNTRLGQFQILLGLAYAAMVGGRSSSGLARFSLRLQNGCSGCLLSFRTPSPSTCSRPPGA
jgi:hypothetical protein